MAKKTKSRIISVRLISMAMTGFFYTFSRPRTSRPMSMLKYDPVAGQPAWCGMPLDSLYPSSNPNPNPPGAGRPHVVRHAIPKSRHDHMWLFAGELRRTKEEALRSPRSDVD
ncbi:hypothetical protein DL769_008722 [Monosporascus sp. CRB-8-3]|nr:hypothetical protein DL769_008722 [Monosporascus sp. CRB-8-3]